ncbi:rab geranylgeranyltransferase [Atractiella rhizophila]|nr:rab geranylgeranyltransferase [Atractiella rhizophila]
MELLTDLHVSYIQSLNAPSARQTIAYHFTEHLRMNGLYWGLTALALLGREDALPKEEVVDWVLSCYDEETGGFAPHPNHDAHIHSTLSAIQILAIEDSISALESKRSKIVTFILSLYDVKTGRWAGDAFGESDIRFTMCAIAALALLNSLAELGDERIEGTLEYLDKCRNFDGGYGTTEGAESHASYVWTSLGTHSILGRMDKVDASTLSWWLCERQLPIGGLNGRPEKLEDVCYSWWCLASLSILRTAHWINGAKLKEFILSCQDEEKGGIADRPEDVADVWHTVFGLAGLSLLKFEGMKAVDPVFCMPSEVTERVIKGHKALAL